MAFVLRLKSFLCVCNLGPLESPFEAQARYSAQSTNVAIGAQAGYSAQSTEVAIGGERVNLTKHTKGKRK